MLNRMRVFHAVGIILLGLFGLALVIATGKVDVQAQDDSLYAKVQAAITEGNQEAADQLARLNAYLAEHGLPIPPQEVEVADVDYLNGTRVRLKGHTPYYVKIYNEPQLMTSAAIAQYIAVRGRTLDQLAAADPERTIQVSISPNEYLDIATWWQFKAVYGLDIDAMTVAFFLDGQRHSTMGVADPKETGETAYIDFTEPAHAVETHLVDLIPDRVLSDEGISPDRLTVTVSWVRGTMRAADAASLNDDTRIMLVDPITDILDVYTDRALDVEVVDMPHLLTEKELGWLNAKAARNVRYEVYVYTGYDPLENSSTWFESEAELSGNGSDPWAPIDWDYLGRLSGCCAE